MQDEVKCPTCGAGTLGDTMVGAVYCPHCGADVAAAADIANDDTIRVPVPEHVLRAHFATDSTMPPPPEPPPLEADELDDEWGEVDGESPTSPETPLAKKSDPPGLA